MDDDIRLFHEWLRDKTNVQTSVRTLAEELLVSHDSVRLFTLLFSVTSTHELVLWRVVSVVWTLTCCSKVSSQILCSCSCSGPSYKPHSWNSLCANTKERDREKVLKYDSKFTRLKSYPLVNKHPGGLRWTLNTRFSFGFADALNWCTWLKTHRTQWENPRDHSCTEWLPIRDGYTVKISIWQWIM